jgi:hypothetical protein
MATQTVVAVNPNSQFAPRVSERLMIGSSALPFDVTTVNTKFRDYQSLVGAGTYAAVPSYNGMTVKFSITPGISEKFHFDKSFIRLRLQLCVVAHPPVVVLPVPIPLPPPNPATQVPVSCPWNPLCVMQSASYSLSNGVLAGKIDNDLAWSTTILRLLDTSREVMNASHTRFITPCIEERMDTVDVTSTVSKLRGLSFADSTAAPNTLPTPREFMIPLSDLFGELGHPVNITCNKVDFTFTFKAPEDTSMTFKNNDAITVGNNPPVNNTILFPAMIVEDCQLVMDVAQLSPKGEAVELARLNPASTLLRVASVYADTKPFTYGAPSTYTDRTITNCIGAALVNPIPPAVYAVQPVALAAGTMINPMQSFLNVTSIQSKIGGNIRQPEDVLPLSVANRKLNTRLYTLYTQLCHRLAASESHYITCALDAHDIQTVTLTAVGADITPYGIAFMSFYDETADVHRTLEGITLDVIPAGGAAWAGSRIVRIRVKYLTITGEYKTIVLE